VALLKYGVGSGHYKGGGGGGDPIIAPIFLLNPILYLMKNSVILRMQGSIRGHNFSR
jgi:hypothetical protein